MMLGCMLLVMAAFAGFSKKYDVSITTRMASSTNGSITGMAARVEVDRNRDGRVDDWTIL